ASLDTRAPSPPLHALAPLPRLPTSPPRAPVAPSSHAAPPPPSRAPSPPSRAAVPHLCPAVTHSSSTALALTPRGSSVPSCAIALQSRAPTVPLRGLLPSRVFMLLPCPRLLASRTLAPPPCTPMSASHEVAVARPGCAVSWPVTPRHHRARAAPTRSRLTVTHLHVAAMRLRGCRPVARLAVPPSPASAATMRPDSAVLRPRNGTSQPNDAS
ncbi:hypothetical protein DENSPDRAFT_887300, partial [Dentipellis sp. KUC8613]